MSSMTSITMRCYQTPQNLPGLYSNMCEALGPCRQYRLQLQTSYMTSQHSPDNYCKSCLNVKKERNILRSVFVTERVVLLGSSKSPFATVNTSFLNKKIAKVCCFFRQTQLLYRNTFRPSFTDIILRHCFPRIYKGVLYSVHYSLTNSTVPSHHSILHLGTRRRE